MTTEATYAASGGIAAITLNRPEKLNAFTEGMFLALRRGLDAAEQDDTVRVLIITGAGRAFSAGQDLTEELPRGADGKLDLGMRLERDFNPLARRLWSYPKITIAAVNGPAAGAAANLAMSCDIVLAAKSAYFQQAFVNIGLVPDAGGTWLLPRIIGSKLALALSLTGERLPADEAKDMGLVFKVFEDTGFLESVNAFAAKFAHGPAVAYRLIKQAFRHSMDNDFEAQLKLEASLQNQAAATQDFIEARAAFKAKRPPAFTGS